MEKKKMMMAMADPTISWRWWTRNARYAMACLLCFVLMSMSDFDVSSNFKARMIAVAQGQERTGTRICVRGEVECKSGRRRCIPEFSFCDGKKDCDDGSDEGDHCMEFDCGPLRGKCPSNRMCTTKQTWWPEDDSIYHPFEWYLCNGVADCYDRSDENKNDCKSFNCTTYQGSALKCPNGVECLWGETDDYSDDPVFQFCDGVPNCKDGSDEAGWYCKNRPCSTQDRDEDFARTAYFRCDGGRCVRSEAFCNGTKECRDGSDERNCQSKACLEGFKKCKDGRTCRAANLFCDGKRDCPDGSDESLQTCGCRDLKQRLCADNRTCVARSKFCDGRQDCPDGSDETYEFAGCYYDKSCNASNGQYQCPTGPLLFSCLSGYNFCDGRKDCADGSDEKIANCRKIPCSYDNEIRCKDGSRCISPSDQCDGEYDCQDRSDEKTSFCKTFDCNSVDRVKCPSGVGCMESREKLCDGKRDCLDGSDETRAACTSITGCNAEQVLCKSPRKCRPGVYCDGIYDCRDGADEDPRFCKNYTCPSETWRCKNDIQCIGTPLVCDGKKHCKDGSDEEAGFCQSYNCTSLEGTGLSRFKCPTNDRKCVSGALCNGYVDCADGSDESVAFCQTHNCPAGQWKCTKTPQCINVDDVCDGNRGCQDDTDEDPAFCKTWECAEGYWKCKDGSKCIYGRNFLCDGYPTCDDGSDESVEVCSTIRCEDFGNVRCPDNPNRCCT